MSGKDAEARSLTFVPRGFVPMSQGRRRKDDRSPERGSRASDALEERDEDGRFKNWPVAGTVCD
jgi:hypothetical protein